VAARPATPVRPGGEVRVAYTPLVETPLDVTIPVLASGPGWLAVDKPAGIPVHPVNRVRENSLIRVVRRQEGADGLRLVHRLDRETSGVLLIARDVPTSRRLAVDFARGRVAKEYLAVVAGEVTEDAGEVRLAIGAARGSRVFVRRAAGEGQPAVTRWRVETRLPGRTVLRVAPETGRRHQIRVHLAAIGHPVLGDLLYGGGDDAYLRLVREGIDVRRATPGPARQLLHCLRLVFPDPASNNTLDVSAPVPLDFPVPGS
jgi:RluA family pseudouridine synthase